MKLLFFSDTHGKTTNLYKIHNIAIKEKVDYLVNLGDTNILSIRYQMNPEFSDIEIENILKSWKEKLINIRGNCDFKRLSGIIYHDYYNIDVDNYTFYLSHRCPNKTLDINGVYIHGHNHVPYIRKRDGEGIEICVGSISFPRDGNIETYMIYENKEFTIYDFLGNIINKYKIGE